MSGVACESHLTQEMNGSSQVHGIDTPVDTQPDAWP